MFTAEFLFARVKYLICWSSVIRVLSAFRNFIETSLKFVSFIDVILVLINTYRLISVLSKS